MDGSFQGLFIRGESRQCTNCVALFHGFCSSRGAVTPIHQRFAFKMASYVGCDSGRDNTGAKSQDSSSLVRPSSALPDGADKHIRHNS